MRKYEDAAWKQGMQQGLQQGKAEGLQQGLQQGMQQGKAEGLQQGKMAVAESMLKDGLAPEIVAKYCELPITQVLQMQKNKKALQSTQNVWT